MNSLHKTVTRLQTRRRAGKTDELIKTPFVDFEAQETLRV